MVNLLLTKNNPVDDVLNYWMLSAIKMYYLPYFIAGSADNVLALFKPQTYNICRV